MYFAPAQVKKAKQNFYRALVPDGWLIVSAVETSPLLFKDFSTVSFPGALLYRKFTEASKPMDVDLSSPPLEILDAAWLKPAGEVDVAQPTSLARSAKFLAGLDNTPSFVPVEQPSELESPSDTYQTAAELKREGRYTEAAELLCSALAANPKDAKVMILLARVYANEGKLDEAAELCWKAIAEEKLDPEVHYLLAIILLEQAKNNEAKHCLKRALYLDQNFVLAHFALGNLHLHQKGYKAAKKHFEIALTILRAAGQEQPLLESEGITSERLIEILETLTTQGPFRR
jgi:chemotaxis protein methyltransferase CheR